MNIYVTRQIPQIGIDMLKAKGYTVVVGDDKEPLSNKRLKKMVSKNKYDGVLTLLTDHIDAEFFDAAGSQLKVVSNYAVGYDNFNLKDAADRGITLTNTVGVSSDCVAEHTVALMLALTTRIVEADSFVKRGKYKGWDPMIFIGTDLCGKTIGLIGAGHIGARAAMHLVKGFEAKVIYYDIKRNADLEAQGAQFVEKLEDVLMQSDIVSLHVPLLPSTHHLMNEERLKMMKPTSFLINTSRGPVVDEKALVAALQKGVIKGAGLDVYEDEPNLARGLVKLPNVVLTPHIASARESARNEMAILAAQNIIDVLEGREPKGKIKTVIS
jgi:lactate dehydrogenase-like 2-hydroxyacid dehydrogenase